MFLIINLFGILWIFYWFYFIIMTRISTKSIILHNLRIWTNPLYINFKIYQQIADTLLKPQNDNCSRHKQATMYVGHYASALIKHLIITSFLLTEYSKWACKHKTRLVYSTFIVMTELLHFHYILNVLKTVPTSCCQTLTLCLMCDICNVIIIVFYLIWITNKWTTIFLNSIFRSYFIFWIMFLQN